MLEKMSKSRGNVVTIDEVVFGVHSLQPGFEFRDEFGGVIEDFLGAGVWRDKSNSGYFFTATRAGKRPVYLHEIGCDDPCLLLLDGVPSVQHHKP